MVELAGEPGGVLSGGPVAAVNQVDVDGRAGQDPDRVGEQVQLGWAGVGGQEPGQAAVVGQAAGTGLAG